MTLALLLLHAVAALLLLGALSHQAIAAWWPAAPADGWWRSLRAVHARRYPAAVALLLAITVALGASLYPGFRIAVRAGFLDAHARWATGLFEIKEHAGAIGLALLPAYWAAWRNGVDRGGRRSTTTLLLALAWWSWLVGEIVNNVRGM